MAVTRIVQLTDLHVFEDPDQRLFGIPTRELLLEVVAHVEEHAGRVDHLVVTGDHTHDELTVSYEAVREILRPWHDRLWLVPGNHEDRTRLRTTFDDRIGGTGAERITFAFAAGEVLCLGLDTQVPGQVAGLIDDAQVEWVSAQIAAHEPAAAVLFMHHPPVLLGVPWLDRIGLEQQELLQDLLLREPRIKLVCCGHIHHETRNDVGNATVVSTPSTGLQFSPDAAEATFVQAPPGYRMIEVDGAELSTRVVRLPEARYVPSQPE